MRIVRNVAIAVVGLATAVGLGLADHQRATAHHGGHAWPRETQANITRARVATADYCAARGQTPRVWVEVNADGTADVYGKCL